MTTLSIKAANTDLPVSVKAGIKSRMAYLDKLKVALTILVIAHHAGQAYGPTGGQWPIFSLERSALLGPFFSVNASFFMGLFFLISGYFVPRAFDRKGSVIFLKDRFRRLGIPLGSICVSRSYRHRHEAEAVVLREQSPIGLKISRFRAV
jgi:uncharacterized membrane protein YcfT